MLGRLSKLAAPLQAKLLGRQVLPVIVRAVPDMHADLKSVIEGAFDADARHLGLGFVQSLLPRDAILSLASDQSVSRIYLDRPVSIPEAVFVDPVSMITSMRDTVVRGLVTGNLRNKLRDQQKDWVPTSESRRYVGADQAQSVGIDGRGVTIGVVDTDGSMRYANIPQLRGKTSTYAIHGLAGKSPDSNGHGGHVSTIAAGRKATSLLGLEVEGMAPGASVIGVKTLYSPTGSGMTSDIISGISVAVKEAAIVNMSLGSQPVGSAADDPMCQAMHDVGDRTIFVVASGNDGPSPGSVDSPGVCPEAITVGAWDLRAKTIADFSSRGPTPGGAVKPDFAMPGVNIYSGLTPRTVMDRVGDYISDGYGVLSGSSQATPHMAGMVALMVQAAKDRNIKVNADMVRQVGERYGHQKSNVDGYGVLTWGMIERSLA